VDRNSPDKNPKAYSFVDVLERVADGVHVDFVEHRRERRSQHDSGRSVAHDRRRKPDHGGRVSSDTSRRE
jgi:hypothetical protein